MPGVLRKLILWGFLANYRPHCNVITPAFPTPCLPPKMKYLSSNYLNYLRVSAKKGRSPDGTKSNFNPSVSMKGNWILSAV